MSYEFTKQISLSYHQPQTQLILTIVRLVLYLFSFGWDLWY
jgi:hypothetical protein